MEHRDLKTFMVVARTLSFHKASAILHTAQSTISTRIGSLEEELGVQLFDRLGRRVILTEPGRRLLGSAQKMLDLEAETRAWVSGASESAGSLTIRVPESLCAYRLDDAIRSFREVAPKIRLRLITCTLEGLAADLRQGLTDLAFAYVDATHDRDLCAEHLGSESLVLVAAPGHPLARQRRVIPSSFQNVPLLLSVADCSYRRMFEGLLGDHGVSPAAGIEFSSLAALKRAVLHGLGVAILPAISIEDEVAQKLVSVLPWSDDPLESGILMLWHKEKWLSPALQSFKGLVRENFAKQGLLG